jgi:small subunit ribosomal protein S16
VPIEDTDLDPTRFRTLTTHNRQGDTTDVAVKIRLKRLGKVRVPQYRIVVVDSRKKRDGRVIEEIGKYHPKEDPSYIDVVSDRAQYWLGVGAQPSEAVAAILKVTGDWQKFKGLPGAEGTLQVKEPKRDKLEVFNEALKDAASEPRGDAVTKKSSAKKAAAPAEEAPAADTVPGVETPEGATEEAEAVETAQTKSDADPGRPDADKQA